METSKILVFTFLVISACTCGARTECVDKAKISVITDLNSKSCDLSNSFQPDNYLVQMYNYSYNRMKIEIAFLDTCGTDLGTLKAVFKSLVWADVNCLEPPYFLGFIGPDSFDNLNVALKITSALQLPHIVGTPTPSVYTHHIVSTEDQLVLDGIFKLLELLGWKSFTLSSNVENDALRFAVNHFVKEAAERRLCILPSEDASNYVVHFGDIDDHILTHVQNSSIIIITDKNIERKLKNINSDNSYMLIDNVGSIFPTAFERRLDSEESNKKNLDWWRQNNLATDDNTNEIEMIYDAVKIYEKALNYLCKNKNCHADKGRDEWNKLIEQMTTSNNYEGNADRQTLSFKIKNKFEDIKSTGRINIAKNDIKVYWNEKLLNYGELLIAHSSAFNGLKNFVSNNETLTNCRRKVKTVDSMNTKHSVDNHKTPSVTSVSEMTDSEWWTMVCTVTGVGIAMFAVGFFAVYIVYTNIRGPRSTKSGGKDFDRDSSLRRVGSDRQPPPPTNPRTTRSALQRRDSRSSIRSNISEKSV